ncbi:MAG TPA: carbohydrate ABC transporter permease [Clostridiales bacterium]|nr:carbohydrate ABC transporter permease [Clostridiales bacterium]
MKRRTSGSIIFNVFNYLFLALISMIALYPLVFILFGSISEPVLIAQHRGLLLKPLGFSMQAYKIVFDNPMVALGYRNTLIYLVLGTTINVALTSLAAYALSRRNILLGNFIMFIIVFTMFFDGGLIPTYLLIKRLNIYNTIWAVIIPNAMRVWCFIIMRTGFQQVPAEMEESAKLDGANDLQILYKIIIPISMPVVAVMILFYGVDHWNSYFNAMIFLRDRKLFNLQLVLREILIVNDTTKTTARFASEDRYAVQISIKYALIIVATVPILLVYPFLQKYFTKGIMVGALKQ